MPRREVEGRGVMSIQEDIVETKMAKQNMLRILLWPRVKSLLLSLLTIRVNYSCLLLGYGLTLCSAGKKAGLLS